ncbi:MAG: calcium-binding protein, partial [Deltaproteobacteria bacterium]
RVSYATAASAITIDLTGAIANKGEAAGDVWTSIEGFNGSDFADQFYGTTNADDFAGGAGNDFFAGRGGADHFDGGQGSDTISFVTASSGVQVWLDGSHASDGDATGVVLTSVENVTGSGFADVIGASSAANLIDGRGGFDTVSYVSATSGVLVNLANSAANAGGAVGDVLVSIEGLIGSAFNDTLIGDAGANRLDGGAGDDILSGAAGADVFVFAIGSGSDTITDFEAGIDHLALDDALWFGESGTLADILSAHSVVDGADLVLTFAGGETLRLHDQAGLDPNDILII